MNDHLANRLTRLVWPRRVAEWIIGLRPIPRALLGLGIAAIGALLIILV